MDEKNNLQEVIAQNEREAREALSHLYGQSSVQMQLFEEWAENKPKGPARRKNPQGLTLAEETYCRLRACGYTRTDSWRKAHPQSTAADSTIWPKASRLDKQDKVQARIEYWKRKITDEALMGTTELFARLTETARARGKDSLDALKLIGQIHGVFKAEKDLPGSASNPLVVQCVDFAAWNKTAAQGEGK